MVKKSNKVLLEEIRSEIAVLAFQVDSLSAQVVQLSDYQAGMQELLLRIKKSGKIMYEVQD